MKKLFLLFILTCLTVAAQAGWPFTKGTQYYITCEWNNEGKVSVGQEHGQAFPLYYQMDSSQFTDDCYWYIEGDETFGFTFKNAKTGQYIERSNDYDNDRYLRLSNELTEYCYWSLKSNENGIKIINTATNFENNTFNLRVGSNHYLHLGCYKESDDRNAFFHIYTKGGKEVNYSITDTMQLTSKIQVNTTKIVNDQFDQNTYWYRLYIRGNKQLSTNGQEIRCKEESTQTDDAAHCWCFVQTGEKRCALYNMATGALAPLSASDDENGTQLLMSKDGETWSFDITENLYEGFNLQIPNTFACCNDFEDAGILRLWNDTSAPQDNGSCIRIEEIGLLDWENMTNGNEPGNNEPGQTEPEEGELVSHSGELVYVLHRNNILTAIPKDYLRTFSIEEGTFSGELISGVKLEYTNIVQASENLPVTLPTFTSYKFNNKFNPQLFTDVVAANPASEEINMKVGGIGKRLTASFQLPDDNVKVWIGNTLQQSKDTRLRFDKPITYTIGYSTWREMQIVKLENGTYRNRFIPFGHHTTVNVDWLTDHSTNNYLVPEIHINTTDGTPITSKDYYWDATIQIKGGGVFPDMKATPMQIKGRGNSSWGGYGSKNPYRIKFGSKVKPLGMTKGKNWILLANKQSGSMTTNAIGHKIASLMGAEYPCHIVPVELYINGSYEGSYNFCEKLGFSNNSIDLADDSHAAMIELDIYADETIYNSNIYGIESKIHDPDVEEDSYTGPLTVESIISDFDRMAEHVYFKDFLPYVDVDALVSFLATCELMVQRELMHPKSVFLYSENVTDGFDLTGNDPTPWKFGPLWDCDWAFGYEGSNSYYRNNETDDYFAKLLGYGSPRNFWNDLRYGSPEVNEAYYARWHKFMKGGAFDELIEYCDDYYQFAAASLAHDNRNWYDYKDVTENCKRWLTERAKNIFSVIPSYEVPRQYQLGDLNGDDLFTVADVAILINVMLGYQFDLLGTADVNEDGLVNYADVVALTEKVKTQKAD